jgi:anti-sigma factor RsiW
MHIPNGRLRAYADGELEAAERERTADHLAGCASCRERLDALRAEAAALDARLRPLAPGLRDAPQRERALARLLEQEKDVGFAPVTGGIMFGNRTLSKGWQRALTGVAVVAVLAVALAFAPVRAAASEFLSIFRLEQITVLPISASQIERMERIDDRLGDDFLPGRTETLVEPGEPQHPATLDEAEALAGFGLLTPPDHPAPDDIVVRGEMVFSATPDVELMRELFEAAELSPDLVPEEIDGQTFVFHEPKSVVQIWSDEEGDEALMITQMPSPSVDYPEEIDEAALASAMLQLLGYAPDEAASLATSIDWSTTLVLPIPTSDVDFHETTVDGAEGFVFEYTPDDAGPNAAPVHTVLWQRNGMITAVSGVGGEEAVLAIANALE